MNRKMMERRQKTEQDKRNMKTWLYSKESKAER